MHPDDTPESSSGKGTFESRMQRYSETVKMCRKALEGGQNRGDLSKYGWPLFNIVFYKVGDRENILGLVPEDIWEEYADIRRDDAESDLVE
jgi:hypothetical protein